MKLTRSLGHFLVCRSVSASLEFWRWENLQNAKLFEKSIHKSWRQGKKFYI